MEHDSPWKEVVEDLFEYFLAFFFPQVHSAIDFSTGYQFLKDALRKIIRELASLQKLMEHLMLVQNLPEVEKLLDEKEVLSH